MKLKTNSIMLVILLVISLLAACGNESTSIKGTWDAISNKGIAGTFDFKDDGTFICDLGILRGGGDYKFENDKLTLMYGDLDKPLIYEIETKDKNSINFYSIDAEGNRTNNENIKMTKK